MSERTDLAVERLRAVAEAAQRAGYNVISTRWGSAPNIYPGDIFSVLDRLEKLTARVAELEAAADGTEQ